MMIHHLSISIIVVVVVVQLQDSASILCVSPFSSSIFQVRCCSLLRIHATGTLARKVLKPRKECRLRTLVEFRWGEQNNADFLR